jgi:hypothetical protein
MYASFERLHLCCKDSCEFVESSLRSGCVTVRINDRGPWVRGRDIDLTPAAARAIGLDGTGYVTIAELFTVAEL